MQLNDGSIGYPATTTTSTWNGGVCPTCATRYLGSHLCSRQDIARKIADLARLLERMPAESVQVDQRTLCPCRPENGGSGVCGCILGGVKVTC